MLYREIIAVCSQIHTKHINTLCGQNVEFSNVEIGGAYSNHWAFKTRPFLFRSASSKTTFFYKLLVTYGYGFTCRAVNIQTRHILPTQCVSRGLRYWATNNKSSVPVWHWWFVCRKRPSGLLQMPLHKIVPRIWQHRWHDISYINYRLQQIDQQKLNFFTVRPATVWIQTAGVTGVQQSIMEQLWNGDDRG